jgi:bisphosphoglycerate-independent phosphoglycerate mutase (AlkP superfamily)
LHYVTMTDYDPRYTGVEVLFRKDDLAMTLGETVSKAGLGQARIAETEKYPHVTFFFSGGREAPFQGEYVTVLALAEGGHLRPAAGNERAPPSPRRRSKR